MRPRTGEVLHFSEDPTIRRFAPHIAPTSHEPDEYVWAVDYARSPDYWFPRNCPRAMAWANPETTQADRDRILGPGGGDRVHAIEYSWLEAMRTVRLYAYRLPAADFHPIGTPVPNAHVSTKTVEPIAAPEPVGDLLHLHEECGIQLRVLNNLWPYWDAVVSTTMSFSGIRLRYARQRP